MRPPVSHSLTLGIRSVVLPWGKKTFLEYFIEFFYYSLSFIINQNHSCAISFCETFFIFLIVSSGLKLETPLGGFVIVWQGVGSETKWVGVGSETKWVGVGSEKK